jgi:WG containing repeat
LEIQSRSHYRVERDRSILSLTCQIYHVGAESGMVSHLANQWVKYIVIAVCATIISVAIVFGKPHLLGRSSSSHFPCNPEQIPRSPRLIQQFLSHFPQEIPISYGTSFSEGISVIGSSKEKPMLLDRYNNITPISSPMLGSQQALATSGSFQEGRLAISPVSGDEGTRMGYVNRQGQVTIPLKFLDTGGEGMFYDGLAMARTQGDVTKKIGYINSQGEWVIPPQFDAATRFSEGLAGVRIDNQWGFINSSGTWVIPPQFSKENLYDDHELYRFQEGLAAVRVGEKVGFINGAGDFVIPPQFEKAKYFSEGLVPTQLNGKWGYTNALGKTVIPHQFRTANPFSEGLARVLLIPSGSESGRVGFVDATGRMIIPAKFEDARDFSSGVAAVEVENQGWGLIDSFGKILLPTIFDGVVGLREGVGIVWQEKDTEKTILDRFFTRQDLRQWLQFVEERCSLK